MIVFSSEGSGPQGSLRKTTALNGRASSGQILNYEEVHSVFTADVIQRADVRVVQTRHSACLLFEALSQLDVRRHMFREHFDRDNAIEPGGRGLVDLTHPAFAKFLLGLDSARGSFASLSSPLSGFGEASP